MWVYIIFGIFFIALGWTTIIHARFIVTVLLQHEVAQQKRLEWEERFNSANPVNKLLLLIQPHYKLEASLDKQSKITLVQACGFLWFLIGLFIAASPFLS